VVSSAMGKPVARVNGRESRQFWQRNLSAMFGHGKGLLLTSIRFPYNNMYMIEGRLVWEDG
jgi:hypothetical protein